MADPELEALRSRSRAALHVVSVAANDWELYACKAQGECFSCVSLRVETETCQRFCDGVADPDAVVDAYEYRMGSGPNDLCAVWAPISIAETMRRMRRWGAEPKEIAATRQAMSAIRKNNAAERARVVGGRLLQTTREEHR